MAVSHVAPHQEAAAKLKSHGFTSKPDQHGNLGVNVDDIYNAEFEVLNDVKTEFGLFIRLKRSGTGIRVTLGTAEGIKKLNK